MPALWIRCTKCDTLVHTGVHMRVDTFDATDLAGHVAQCIKCRTFQPWSKGDVDPASFVRRCIQT